MNAIRLWALTALVTIVGTHNSVLAQDATNSRSTATRDNPLVVTATPGYLDYYGSRFSSTNAEGLGRGLGAFANGIGEMNLKNSMAAANFEEARRRAIENRRMAVENYFAMRRINEEYRVAQLHRRGTMIYTTQADKAEQASAYRAKPATSTINWPEELLGPEYSAYRKQLESRFARRAATASSQRTVKQVTQAMKDRLKTQIHYMDSGDYVAAKKFLDDLVYQYDSRLANGSEPVASR
jgi:hypothetical protein